MGTKKATYPDIVVNGVTSIHDDCKIHELEENEIPRLVEDIRQAGIYAREHDYIDSKAVVFDGPLNHAERLIKHQLNRLFHGKYISIGDLENPGDFGQWEYFIRGTDCIKTSFLFVFLRDVVAMKTCPEGIDERDLDKFENNLRGLFILAESQLTGAQSHESSDLVFDCFAYALWKKNESRYMTIDAFWRYITKFLIEKEGDFEFEWENHSYVARLEPYPKKDNEKYQIKIDCENDKTKSVRARGERWFKDNWPKLQRKFKETRK